MNESNPQNDPTTPNSQPAMPPPIPPSTPPADALVSIPMDEIQKGKLFALLSYGCAFIGIPFFIVPLLMRDNAFSLYHGKQMLMLYIVGIIVAIVAFILTFVCVGVFIWIGLVVFNFIMVVIGLLNVSDNKAKPLPVIGGLAEQWFAGIRKQQI